MSGTDPTASTPREDLQRLRSGLAPAGRDVVEVDPGGDSGDDPVGGGGDRGAPGVDAGDVRAALEVLVASLRSHLDAVERRKGESDQVVNAAYQDLREAFLAYDELLYDVHDDVLPVEVVEETDEDEDEDDEDDDEELVEL